MQNNTTTTSRPQITISNRQLRDITAEALGALRAYNQPPKLFVRSGQPVRVTEDERGRHVIAAISESAMRGYMTRAADYRRVTAKGKVVQCSPPVDAVRDILALPPLLWEFLPLAGVVEALVLRPSGTVLTDPGYDPETRLVYAPPEGFRLPPLPCCPNAADIQHARSTLMGAIEEFPLVGQAGFANALAALITPICRPAINGPTPLGLIDATVQGSGKTLLTEIISICATGRPGALFSAPDEEAEWRKQITSVLCEGTTTIVIDNVTQRLDSPELCKALTESTHADRILGTNEIISLPVLACWYATGNNMQVGLDMPRRVYWVRIDPKCARPFMRTGFKHPNLKDWAIQNRGHLLHAMLSLALAWTTAGRPAPRIRPVGSYESWTTVVGGVLEHAGVEGFLANAEERALAADAESQQYEAFLLTLGQIFPEPFVVAEIVRKLDRATWPTGIEPNDARRLREALPDYIADAADRPASMSRRLGNMFRACAGRRHGSSGVYVERDGTINHAIQWKVQLSEEGSL